MEQKYYWGNAVTEFNIIRATVICEGQSEDAFVKRILSPYILSATDNRVLLQPRIVVTLMDRRKGKKYTGGLVSFSKAWGDISKTIREGLPVATMFDFFQLPGSFPGYSDINAFHNDREKAEYLEKCLYQKVMHDFPSYPKGYFIPYLQLHEFETLFFCDLTRLKDGYLSQGEQKAIDHLIKSVKGIAPEDINNGPDTAPSKRLLNTVAYHKGENASDILEKIGIEKMISMCPHFCAFVNALKGLANISS